MSVSQRVKEIRHALGLTQIEFGEKVGISQGHLTGIEHGKKNVTAKTIKVICATFNINEAWLRSGEGEMQRDTPDAARIEETMSTFAELDPEFQEYIYHQIKNLLEIQKRKEAEHESAE
jgi:transcriptional regulator with XRE-family HTH domain